MLKAIKGKLSEALPFILSLTSPISFLQQVDKVTKLDAEATCPFVGESLKQVG